MTIAYSNTMQHYCATNTTTVYSLLIKYPSSVICSFLLLVLLLNVKYCMVHAAHANITYEEILRPDLEPQYIQWRRSCEWKVSEKRPWDECNGDRMECKVPVETEEGKGYLVIVRYGPYTSTGGYMQTRCIGSGHVPPLGAWLIFGVLGPIDPYSEEYLEFPPFHVHHIVPQIQSFNPLIPKDIAEKLPFLSFWHQSNTTFMFPTGAADNQCLPEFGGKGCFYHHYPTGYGKRAYQIDEDSQYVFHVQDVRKPDSPSLSYSLEYGEMFITELNPQVRIKPVADMTLGVYGKRIPYTYAVKENTYMYNFVTYYFPMKAQLVGNRMHWHPIQGDEAWVVRGTQDDLGIPRPLQRPVALNSYESPVGIAIPIKGNGPKDMAAFKYKMQKHIQNAASEFRKKYGSTDRSPMRSNIIADTENPETPLIDGIPYLHLRKNSISPHAPKILCKYFGESERINSTVLAQKIKEQMERPKIPFAGNRSLINGTFGPSARKHKPIATRGLVDFDAHRAAMFDGVQIGDYYRASTNTNLRFDRRFPHCNEFEVEPGEFITVIHFIEKRTKPKDPDEYDRTFLTLQQHTALVSHIHIPHLPYL